MTALAAAVGMEQSAVSHQFRLLRALGLVTGRRHGRQVVHRLYDAHVAQLLDQAVHHIEHLRLGVRDSRWRGADSGPMPGPGGRVRVGGRARVRGPRSEVRQFMAMTLIYNPTIWL